jgi:hypothetical protein
MFEVVVSKFCDQLDGVYKNYQRIGADLFKESYCLEKTNILKQTTITIDTAKREFFNVRQNLVSEKYFDNQNINPSSECMCALFWIFQVAALCHLRNATVWDYHEEVQNAEIFGAITACIDMINVIAGPDFSNNKFNMYRADCKTEGSESALGADFCIIIPISADEYKVSLFQAKKVINDNRVSVHRKSPLIPDYEQLTCLLEVEEELRKRLNHSVSEGEDLLLDSLCYYVFWHPAASQMLPTVLSARQANQQIIDSHHKDFSVRQKGSKSKMMIKPLTDGTWFSEFIPLLVADPKLNYGFNMKKEDIIYLLGKNLVKSVIGVQVCDGLSLLDWKHLISEDIVKNQEFYIDQKKLSAKEYSATIAKKQTRKDGGQR